MLKGCILCKKKVNKIPFKKRYNVKKYSFFAEITFFFLRKGLFFLCFFFVQTHWEDCIGVLQTPTSMVASAITSSRKKLKQEFTMCYTIHVFVVVLVHVLAAVSIV